MAPYSHDEVIHNFAAAEAVLPILFEKYKPISVLDVGCGLGNWAAIAKKMGVPKILGIDGYYVNKSLLKINQEEFLAIDLKESFDLKHQFDLVICLEVAEHLPIESSEVLVKSLINHSEVILFSAAIPGQGGQFHINEQWPSFWQQLFEKNGYEMIDFFRNKIWNNSQIDPWYRQNLFLVVKKGHSLSSGINLEIQSYIHPELFTLFIRQQEAKIRIMEDKIKKLSKRDVIGNTIKIIKKIFSK
jgi:SAM-dependent methyltransferase